MRIGIDISQLAYSNTGVASYLESFVNSLLKIDTKNEYVLFFSSLRRTFDETGINFGVANNITVKQFKIPPTILDIIWNKLHIAPIEWFVGDLDLFITSDWTEPPVKKAKKGTIIYDMIIYKYPQETHAKTNFNASKLIISPNIVKHQKRKHSWVKKESDIIFTISESSKKDIEDLLGIESSKINVIYPGL